LTSRNIQLPMISYAAKFASCGSSGVTALSGGENLAAGTRSNI